MERRARVEALYDEIFAHYRPRDPALVRRRLVPDSLESRVVLLGQALGRDTQRLSGLPYCIPPPEHPTLSRGGRELDRFLTSFGYTIQPGGRGQYAYHTDLAHYFPGRKARGTGDLEPTATEIEHNRRWLLSELRIIHPAVVIMLGLCPSSVFLERYASLPRVHRLRDVAAEPIPCMAAGHKLHDVGVHHPSGAFQHPQSRQTYTRAAANVRRLLEEDKYAR